MSRLSTPTILLICLAMLSGALILYSLKDTAVHTSSSSSLLKQQQEQQQTTHQSEDTRMDSQFTQEDIVRQLQHRNPSELIEMRRRQQESNDKMRHKLLYVLPKPPQGATRNTLESNTALAGQWQTQLQQRFGEGVTVRAVSRNKLAVSIPGESDEARLDEVREAVKALDGVEYTEWAAEYTIL